MGRLKRGLAALTAAALLPGLSACGRAQPYSETRFLLDTVCTVRAGGEAGKAAVQAAFAAVQEVQEAVDFYDESSTVAAFNRAGAGQPVPLDRHTAAILETALKVSRDSQGAFDVTVASVQTLWPFHGEENPRPPSRAEVEARLPLVGYQKLLYDPEARTLAKTQEGVTIDLGGAAKGYAADQALAAMEAAGADYGLLDLGGSIAVLGKNPGSRDGSWQVGLQEPFAETGTYRETVTVTAGAVVTSGTYQRNFTYQGRRYHHILDPATGYPADSGLSGVTVVAESGLLADCLSTAILVLGPEKGRALAQTYGVEIYLNDKGA